MLGAVPAKVIVLAELPPSVIVYFSTARHQPFTLSYQAKFTWLATIDVPSVTVDFSSAGSGFQTLEVKAATASAPLVQATSVPVVRSRQMAVVVSHVPSPPSTPPLSCGSHSNSTPKALLAPRQ